MEDAPREIGTPLSLWQVFGLTGEHRYLLAIASRVSPSAIDGGRSCLPLRVSSGFTPDSLFTPPTCKLARYHMRLIRLVSTIDETANHPQYIATSAFNATTFATTT